MARDKKTDPPPRTAAAPAGAQTTNEIPVACFAPPLTDELLDRYEGLAAGAADRRVADAMRDLLACCRAWWELPESTRTDGRRWRVQRGAAGAAVEYVETPLTDELVDRLWDVTPYMDELNVLSTPRDDGPFDRLPPGELRDAAFHLLWHAKEITLDREPLTSDKLPEA